MQHVPPVNVDISTYMLAFVCPRMKTNKQPSVLDPYVLNIFPRSLLPTAGYLITLGVLSWFLSSYIWQGIHDLAQAPGVQYATLNRPRSSSRDKKDS